MDVRKTINKPVHEIPGNHDPQDLFVKYIRPQIDTSFEPAAPSLSRKSPVISSSFALPLIRADNS